MLERNQVGAQAIEELSRCINSSLDLGYLGLVEVIFGGPVLGFGKDLNQLLVEGLEFVLPEVMRNKEKQVLGVQVGI